MSNGPTGEDIVVLIAIVVCLIIIALGAWQMIGGW